MRKLDKDITEAEKREARRRIMGQLSEESSSGDDTPAVEGDASLHAASTM